MVEYVGSASHDMSPVVPLQHDPQYEGIPACTWETLPSVGTWLKHDVGHDELRAAIACAYRANKNHDTPTTPRTGSHTGRES